MNLASEIRFRLHEARPTFGSIDGRDLAASLLLRRPYRPGHSGFGAVAKLGIKLVAATATTTVPVEDMRRRGKRATERRLTEVADRSDAAIPRDQLFNTLPEPHPFGVSVTRVRLSYQNG